MPMADRDRLPFNPPDVTRTCVLRSAAPCEAMCSAKSPALEAAWNGALRAGNARCRMDAGSWRCLPASLLSVRPAGKRRAEIDGIPCRDGTLPAPLARRHRQAADSSDSRPISSGNRAEAERGVQPAQSIRPRPLFPSYGSLRRAPGTACAHSLRLMSMLAGATTRTSATCHGLNTTS